tara:strand:- start:1314 stop:2222 length:909 start_codon:yes stop_codon:yes gene_type:complete
MNNEIKTKIFEINKRTDLSLQEKNQEISKIFRELYNSNINNTTDTTNTTNPDKHELKTECNHYKRKCMMQCPNKDCLLFVNCRLCHNENREHKLDRFNIKKIKCKECNLIQPPSNKCIKCKIIFSKYYCKICNLWDSTENKDIYHCKDCKICRVGKKEDYIHCLKCNLCINKDSYNSNHKCFANNSNSNCPICSEDMFSSTNPVNLLQCGHCIHAKCLKEYTKTKYSCPICRKSLSNLKSHWNYLKELIKQRPMPEEYKDWKVKIFCNDCEKKCIVSKHFIGNECNNCNSYNTDILEEYRNL